MPVIIKNLIVSAEVGKTEINKGSKDIGNKTDNGSRQRILKLEEFTDQMIQIINDKKER